MSERPDDSTLADRAAAWAGAYVHIPFCARVCPYCDFNVVADQDDLIPRYVDAVVAQIRRAGPWRPLTAVAFGGGTPTRLSPTLLGRIVDALSERFGFEDEVEMSLEANPEDWSREMAEGLHEVGFTRVSFGAQSFDPAVLEFLGRGHTPDQIGEAVLAARKAGFGSVNLDLIFGSPNEDLASWRESLRQALRLEPDHLSLYSLTIEPGTAFRRAVLAGAPEPDPDVQATEYEIGEQMVTAAGLIRYEVSNYARPGHACRYNLLTWAQGEYEGFGAGAHGYRHGTRTRLVRRTDRYLERVEAAGDAVQGRETLDGPGRERERLYLGLRRVAGVQAGHVGKRLVESWDGRRLVDAGVLMFDGVRLRLLQPLLTDEVSRTVLAL